MRTYKQLLKDSKKLNEHNDCAVKAVALISNTSYQKVHKMFATNGRRHRGTASHSITSEVVQQLGLWTEEIEVCSRTIRQLVNELPKKGRYLVRVRGHLLAIINGSVEDWTAGRKHRVQKVLKVSF